MSGKEIKLNKSLRNVGIKLSTNKNDTSLYFFQKLDVMLHDKRRILHKFLSLMEDVEAINKWSITATEHLDRDEDLDRLVFSTHSLSYVGRFKIFYQSLV